MRAHSLASGAGAVGAGVVCGGASDALGESSYEAVICVRGNVAGLGADCVVKTMRPDHLTTLAGLLAAAEINADPSEFQRYGSARKLYNFDIDNVDDY